MVYLSRMRLNVNFLCGKILGFCDLGTDMVGHHGCNTKGHDVLIEASSANISLL